MSITAEIMKTCSLCKNSKEHNQFSPSKISKDGLAYICKPCRATLARKDRQDKGIKEKIKPKIVDSQHKECLICHQILNIDKYPLSKRGSLGRGSYCIDCNRDYHKKIRSKYGHKEKSKAATQKYRDNHREHWRSLHRVNQFNRKSKCKAQSDNTITEQFMKDLYASEICCWCNKFTPVSDRTAEHIIPLHNGGIHGISNLKMACVSCNSSKLNFQK